MNSNVLQIIGNVCAGLATIVFLFPLQNWLWSYADKHVNNDDWTSGALYVLVPLWLLLLGGLLCVTATGGFDSLRLGRTLLYVLTVASSVSLAAVTFVFIALYIRPGFTPRIIYTPGIFLVPLATVLLVVLSLNQKFVPGFPTQWLRWPWTVFAALSIVGCVIFFGHRIAHMNFGVVLNLAYRFANLGPSTSETLAKVAALDPEKDFSRLLDRANHFERRAVQEAATARLRAHPKFIELLSAELRSGYAEPALMFLRDATLTSEEQNAFARPALRAMEHWVNEIPAPNYTTKKRFKELRSWGKDMFAVIPGKFAGTGVDFGPVLEEFNEKVEAKR